MGAKADYWKAQYDDLRETDDLNNIENIKLADYLDDIGALNIDDDTSVEDDAIAYMSRLYADTVDFEGQFIELGTFIMDNVPGEPSRSEGAVDTAIRLIRYFMGENEALTTVLGGYVEETTKLHQRIEQLQDEVNLIREDRNRFAQIATQLEFVTRHGLHTMPTTTLHGLHQFKRVTFHQ